MWKSNPIRVKLSSGGALLFLEFNEIDLVLYEKAQIIFITIFLLHLYHFMILFVLCIHHFHKQAHNEDIKGRNYFLFVDMVEVNHDEMKSKCNSALKYLL